MAGETTVGSIIAYLRMDDSDWRRTIDDAKARAEDLGRTDPKIKINVDSASALAQLEAVRAAEARVDESNRKMGESSKQAGGMMGVLIASLVGVGAAAVPLAGVAAGLGAGFAVAGAVGVLAILGVKNQMAQGTQIGLQYKAGLAGLNAEFQHLQALSAAGVLTGFNTGLASLHGLYPEVNRDVALFSTQLGVVVGHLVPGLVSLFTGLNPLFNTFGTELVRGSAAFQNWAQSSDSVGKFVAYAQTNLPLVEHTLGELITTISHLVVGLAPLGGVSLSTIGLLSRLINEIPLPVLERLLPAVLATVVAFKGFQSLNAASAAVGGMAAKLRETSGAASGLGGVLGSAATGLRTMGIVGLAAGPILGLLVGWLNKQKQAQMEAQQSVNDYTQALLASNLAIDASVRAAAAKKLSDQGLFEIASRLGISQTDLTNAVLGVGNGMDVVKSKIADGAAQLGVYQQQAMSSGHSIGGVSDKTQQLQADLGKLSGVVQQQSSDFEKGAKAAADQKAAIDGVNASTSASEQAQAGAAAAMGLTTSAYQAGTAAAQQHAASIQSATEAMQFENDAAGLLKQTVDALNGVTLDVASAQTQAANATLVLEDAVKKNGNTTDLATDAGVKNRQEIENDVRAHQNYAEAQAKTTKSGDAAYKMLVDQRNQFLKNIDATYGANSAVAQYARTVYGVPKGPITTGFDAQTAAAAQRVADFKAQLSRIPTSKTVSVYADTSSAQASVQQLVRGIDNTVAYVQVQHIGGGGGGGKAQINADGGPIRGPGTGTSDSILSWLSNGEYVVKASEASKHRQLLDAINNGNIPKFASGGHVGHHHSVSHPAAPKIATVKVVVEQLTATSGGGSAYGIADVIKGQTGQAKTAMADLSAAVNDAFQLKGVLAQLAYAKGQLSNLIAQRAQFASSITSSLAGNVDASKYADVGGLLAAYQSQTASNNTFTVEESALAKRGLNHGLLSELMQKGDSAGLAALYGASNRDLSQVNAAYAAYQRSAATGGAVAGQIEYAPQINAWQKIATSLQARGTKLEGNIDALVAAIGKMTNRPVAINLDGKTISHAVIGGSEFQGVFDSLRNQLVYGRRA